jgi:mannose-6-phosphate isomerase class I
MQSNFNKTPSIKMSGEYSCHTGWPSIGRIIRDRLEGIPQKRKILVIECYQGLYENEIIEHLRAALNPALFIHAAEAMRPAPEIEKMVRPDVTDDRIFGFMTRLNLEDFFDDRKTKELRNRIEATKEGLIIVFGIGASIVQSAWDLLLYADMPRWELQQRMRRHEVDSIGLQNRQVDPARLYKQGYFVDWRVCDRQKVKLMDHWDGVLDTTRPGAPQMLDGDTYRQCLAHAVTRPFSLVPFFDPGPWGGQWMKEVCDLDRSQVNYAWCFNCVPEENSLLFQFGDVIFETPAINLVFHQSVPLLGEAVYERFGAEFPIRFDFLDTMGGGNLSFQVHPTVEYIREHFGLSYTQDESYYFLDAKEGAIAYLGVKEETDPARMMQALRAAQHGDAPFEAERFVATWPVKKHDHLLIPAGTVHCQGQDSMVLEISATPYIFTFKLWDWGRVGLDGKPRPINIDRGEEVIQWERRTRWTRENLVNRIEVITEGDGGREERTGLHELEFIETRRHWFSQKALHDTRGTVNVLNLVEGREAVVESPEGAFEPFVVHYAETFVVPAAVGPYTIRPCGESEGEEVATIKAYVREG